EEFMKVTGSYRTQWVGMDGAPKTASLSVNTPINDKIGIGVSLVNDNIGISDENNLAVDLSYGFKINTVKLAFGIKTSLNLLSVDYSKLSIFDKTDQVFLNNIESQFSPNVGTGIYAYSDKFYAGLSVPQLLETKGYNTKSYAVVQKKAHAYLIGGYVFDLDYNLKFKPAFMMKAVQGAPLQLDTSANFLYAEKFSAGISYRLSSSFSTLLGFQVSDKLFVGYSYDTEITKLSNYNSGSHEIFIGFKILKGKDAKLFNPRFF
ncbi:MAG: type IX secretion system membrane protein PorP/SprF, partial [Flavobacterium sp.]